MLITTFPAYDEFIMLCLYAFILSLENVVFNI